MEQPLTSIQRVWMASQTPVITIPKNIYDLLELEKDELIEVSFKKLNNQRGEPTTETNVEGKITETNSPSKTINVRRK